MTLRYNSTGLLANWSPVINNILIVGHCVTENQSGLVSEQKLLGDTDQQCTDWLLSLMSFVK